MTDRRPDEAKLELGDRQVTEIAHVPVNRITIYLIALIIPNINATLNSVPDR